MRVSEHFDPSITGVPAPTHIRSMAAFAATIFLLGCGGGNAPPGHVGGPMPEYSAVTLDGADVSLREDYAGQAVLLNIWTTWCPPCRHEIPELNDLHHEFVEQGLAVIGVSVDAGNSEEQVREFLEDFDVEYSILHDPEGRINRVVQAYGLPTTLLVDRDGTVRWRKVGAVTADDPQLRDALADVL